MTRVTGFGELQLKMSDRDLCSSFMMESAWPIWGVPLLLTYLSVFILSDSIDSGGPMVSPGGDLVLGFSRSSLGKGGAARVRWRFGSCARCAIVVGRAVVVGHAQAMSCLIKSHSIEQGTSHRLGRVSSALNGKEREFLAPPFCLLRLVRPSQPLFSFPFPNGKKGEGFRPVSLPVPHPPPPFFSLLAMSVLESHGGF